MKKLVFVDVNLPRHTLVNYPQLNEVITVKRIFKGYNEKNELKTAVEMVEYPVNKEGGLNGIVIEAFRKPNYQFGEDTICAIEEGINEKILIKL